MAMIVRGTKLERLLQAGPILDPALYTQPSFFLQLFGAKAEPPQLRQCHGALLISLFRFIENGSVRLMAVCDHAERYFPRNQEVQKAVRALRKLCQAYSHLWDAACSLEEAYGQLADVDNTIMAMPLMMRADHQSPIDRVVVRSCEQWLVDMESEITYAKQMIASYRQVVHPAPDSEIESAESNSRAPPAKRRAAAPGASSAASTAALLNLRPPDATLLSTTLMMGVRRNPTTTGTVAPAADTAAPIDNVAAAAESLH